MFLPAFVSMFVSKITEKVSNIFWSAVNGGVICLAGVCFSSSFMKLDKVNNLCLLFIIVWKFVLILFNCVLFCKHLMQRWKEQTGKCNQGRFKKNDLIWVYKCYKCAFNYLWKKLRAKSVLTLFAAKNPVLRMRHKMSDNFYVNKKFSDQLISNVFHLLKYFPNIFVCSVVCLLTWFCFWQLSSSILPLNKIHSWKWERFLKVTPDPPYFYPKTGFVSIFSVFPNQDSGFAPFWWRVNKPGPSLEDRSSDPWVNVLSYSSALCDVMRSHPCPLIDGCDLMDYGLLDTDMCPWSRCVLTFSMSPRLLHGWCVLTKPTRKHTNGANPEYQHRPSTPAHES